MKHYNCEELDLYRHKDMNWMSRIICRVHLYYCASCREQMSQLQHDDQLLLEIKDSINMLKIEPNSTTYRIIGTAIHEDTGKGASA